ncbi:MAG: DUF3108 domain-containing protein [Bacteroidota bacterium]
MFKTRNIYFLIFLNSFFAFSQNSKLPFKDGEFLKYKISYGLLHAGFTTLQVDEIEKNGKTIFHVDGNGWTVGMLDFFFSVEDNYQTYFDKNTLQPLHFIRKIDEGGYTKNKEIFFNYQKNQALVKDHKNNSEKSFFIQNDVNDMLSVLYYLRSMNFDTIKQDEIFLINMFFDDKMTKIELKYMGKDIINTKFGKVKTIVIKPQVEVGRIFKENESVTIWLSDDDNKIPIKIKANVLVGSIKAELYEYKELSNIIIFN